MSVRLSRRLLTAAAAAIALSSTAAQAQTPPIKSGLWEMVPDAADAARMARSRQSMEKMPPELRAKMEEMMKSKGVDISGDALRVCISRESLSRDDWTNRQGRCQTQFTSRSSSAWKWHSVCTDPVSETDGEAVFASSENYTINVTSTSSSGTRARSMKMLWKSGDCGDVKPVNVPH